MNTNELIKLGVEKFLNLEGTIGQITRELHLKDPELLTEYLKNLGYKVGQGISAKTAINLKNAVDDYVNSKEPSLTKLAEKHGINRNAISKRLKELNITVINYQNKTKFNENIFDSIDTEEKAYWLGFIFADGYIDSSPLDPNKKSVYNFELSLKADDINHLNKFNKFMEHIKDNVRVGNTKYNGKTFERCRWIIANKHLWETLNSLGCVPNKSLILKFPNKSIFKDESLIRHFIRGYWDGDGCLSWKDAIHLTPNISVLGTESFLLKLRECLPYISNNRLSYNNKNNNLITRVLSAQGKVAFNVIKYLYNNATIYLDRKYEKYLEYCRLYEESYRGLESKNGEGWDANTVLNSEITRGSESV